MKEYRIPSGKDRLWFEGDEIEQIMEAELCKSGRFPDPADPSLDIESFLEFHLGVKLDLYAVLEADVLGETRFIKRSRPLILINRDLTSEAGGMRASGGRLGRWRATMAHEAAHVILHQRLFEMPVEQELLFPVDDSSSNPSLLRCLRRNVSFGPVRSDWREVQANRGMASLLMPKKLVSGLVRTIVGASSAEDLIGKTPEAGSVALTKLVKELGSLCKVSKEAARIRLETLSLIRDPNESILGGITT